MRKGTPSTRKRVKGDFSLDPAATTTMAYTDYLRASLEQLEQAVLDASSAGSWQAMSTLKLRALETRRLLDEEIAKASSPDDTMNDEQLLAIIVQAVASLPAQHLERIEDAVELRRGGKVLRLAGGGA